jgi:hypothetical protein
VLQLGQRIPVLATVTTTASRRTAANEVGLTRRMRAGVGQFLTPEQIEHRRATKLSQLLVGLRGIKVWNDPLEYEATVEGTRGVGSCVSFVVDGSPTTVLSSHDVDNLIEPSAIGAIEVYSSAERPAGMGGMQERPPEDPSQPPPKIDLRAQQCVLVAIWSRSRLGLDNEQSAGAPAPHSGLRVQPVLTDTTRCELPPSGDSIAAPLYAAIESNAAPVAHDSAWSMYLDGLLGAIRRAFVAPSVLPVMTIGAPFATGEAETTNRDAAIVAPTLSSVVVFTLDSTGAVHNLRMAASSLSGAADTSLLAAIADASDSHAIASPPPRDRGSPPLRFDLTVATGRPTTGERAALLGTLLLPSWSLRQSATLAPGGQVRLPPGQTPTRAKTDSATFEFVVDERGHVAKSTVRAVAVSVASSDSLRQFIDWSARALSGLQFKPAVIGSCPVRQLIRTTLNPPQ